MAKGVCYMMAFMEGSNGPQHSCGTTAQNISASANVPGIWVHKIFSSLLNLSCHHLMQIQHPYTFLSVIARQQCNWCRRWAKNRFEVSLVSLTITNRFQEGFRGCHTSILLRFKAISYSFGSIYNYSGSSTLASN